MKAVLGLLLIVLTSFHEARAGDGAFDDAQINAAMAKADSDGNGEVGLAEARHFGLTMDTFRKANPDRDGSLDRAEFAAALRMQFESTRNGSEQTLDWRQASRAGVRSKQIFDAADPDGDGRLTLAEYLAAMTAQAK